MTFKPSVWLDTTAGKDDSYAPLPIAVWHGLILAAFKGCVFAWITHLFLFFLRCDNLVLIQDENQYMSPGRDGPWDHWQLSYLCICFPTCKTQKWTRSTLDAKPKF